MDADFSHDDRFVYAGAASGIVVLELKDDNLSFVELAQGDGEMRGVRGCIVSPDGHWVYATAHETGVLEAFKRNETTGKLELSQVLKNGQDDVASLAGAFRVAESADSKFLYVSSGRFHGDQAVGVYAVQPDGQLKVLQQLINGTDEFTEFEGGNSICASPDGKFVCAVASLSDRFFRFTRDAASGKLTLLGSQQAGNFAPPGAAGVCFSPDGKFLYIADEKENAIEAYKLP
jgi:6-phosphogluconolactonase (cycloisomerase 2 family)